MEFKYGMVVRNSLMEFKYGIVVRNGLVGKLGYVE